MALTVTHPFVSAKADGADTTLVQPSDWNDNHSMSGALDIANGGTGQTTQTAAFDALAPTTTEGDIIYHNGTDNVRLAKGSAGQILMMNSGATAPEWSSSTGISFKNKIIGGDFTTNPWQRGTSFTGIANGIYSADRFVTSISTDAVVDVLKTADAPTVAEAGVFTQHCLHLDVTTADASIGAAQYWQLLQKIEGLNVASFGFGQAGTRYVTLSFWVKTTKTGAYYCGIYNSAANRRYFKKYTVNASDTWEKKTLTFPVDTTGTWLYDNGIGLQVRWTLACGTDFHVTADTWVTSGIAGSDQVNALDSTANNFKLALIQLEAGSTATNFDVRDVGTEQALAQRYYEKSYGFGIAPGTVSDVGEQNFYLAGPAGFTGAGINVTFATSKRATPGTITTYSPATGTSAKIRDQLASADITPTVTGAGIRGFRAYATQTSAAQVNWRMHWTADAEL